MTINYPFPLIAGTAASIHSDGAQLENQISDMDTMVTNRLAGCWQGEGSDSYQQIARRWSQSAADVRQALAQLGTAIDESGIQMQAKDRLNAGRFTFG
ncbi:WXG100 family type VII secretion target [Mycobacterium kansasii]|uniref:WXG100 family type VII secretion target n=1 Tax=Mycobacterium sp. MS3 TaxID=3391378 RepID=UPI00398997DB